MSRVILLAWWTGLGLMTYRTVKQSHEPTPAGAYFAASGLYALCALGAEYTPAAGVAATVAWGFNLAVALQVLPASIQGGTGKK